VRKTVIGPDRRSSRIDQISKSHHPTISGQAECFRSSSGEDYEACLKEGVLSWEREARAKYQGA